MPTEPNPFAQVNTGMRVVDSAGQQVGTVSAVQMPATTGPLSDLTPADAERLTSTGYLRVDGGLLSRTIYVEGDQVANVAEMDGGVVTLNVSKEALITAS